MVGEKEETNNAVNVRTRDNKIHGEISVTSSIDKLKNLKQSRTLNAEEEFWRPFPVRSLCNLILTPKLAFSLITISTSKNLEPIVSSAAGHSENRVRNWVVDTHKIWFTRVYRQRTRVGNFKFPKCLEKLKWENVHQKREMLGNKQYEMLLLRTVIFQKINIKSMQSFLNGGKSYFLVTLCLRYFFNWSFTKVHAETLFSKSESVCFS